LLLAAAAVLFFSLVDARAQAPAKSSSYPSVNALPPSRDAPAMTSDERAQLKKELSAARDRVSAAAKARDKSAK
jgi:hypothetical protein